MTDVYSKIEDSDDLDIGLVHKMFMESYGGNNGLKLADIFDEDSEYDVGRQLARDFADKSGFKVSVKQMSRLVLGWKYDN